MCVDPTSLELVEATLHCSHNSTGMCAAWSHGLWGRLFPQLDLHYLYKLIRNGTVLRARNSLHVFL